VDFGQGGLTLALPLLKQSYQSLIKHSLVIGFQLMSQGNLILNGFLARSIFGD